MIAMDKIWDKKSFEVGGHWPLWRGWKNRMTTQNRQKVNAKKIQFVFVFVWLWWEQLLLLSHARIQFGPTSTELWGKFLAQANNGSVDGDQTDAWQPTQWLLVRQLTTELRHHFNNLNLCRGGPHCCYWNETKLIE